jgi:hypothetical protein
MVMAVTHLAHLTYRFEVRGHDAGGVPLTPLIWDFPGVRFLAFIGGMPGYFEATARLLRRV